jgi:hypothetical protein
VLLRRIGEPVVVEDITRESVLDVLDSLK